MKFSPLTTNARVTAIAGPGGTALRVPLHSIGCRLSNLSAKTDVTLDSSPNWVKGSQVLTFTQGATDGKIVTIGSAVYTFKTALTGAARQVLIQASKELDLVALAAAINDDEGNGYYTESATSAHPDVRAASSAATLTVTAIDGGLTPNAIVTTTDVTGASWGAGTLAGGAEGDQAGFGCAIPALGVAPLPEFEWDASYPPELRFWNTHATTTAAINVTFFYQRHVE